MPEFLTGFRLADEPAIELPAYDMALNPIRPTSDSTRQANLRLTFENAVFNKAAIASIEPTFHYNEGGKRYDKSRTGGDNGRRCGHL